MSTENNHHILSYGKLFTVFAGLIVLTGITVGVSYVDLGAFNVWVALLVASCKGTLVLMFFMHLKYEGKFFIYSFISTLFFLAIMISFTFWDVAFR